MNHNYQKLVLRDFPIALWLFGLASGGYAIYAYITMPKQIIAIAVSAAISALIFLLTTVMTLTVDRARGTLTIRHTGLLIRKTKEIPITNIAAIEIERSSSLDNTTHRSLPTYRIVVITKGNEKIPLHAYYSSNLRGYLAQANRLRQFLGVGGADASPAKILQVASMEAAEQFRREQESITGRQDEERITDGVRWKLQTLAVGSTPISRWHSPDFQWPGHFLYLAQKIPGQPSTGGLMALMGKMLFKTSLGLYGFHSEMTPGIENAVLLSPLDPQLEPHFLAFTSNPAGARQILNPWTQIPLTEWARKYPARQSGPDSVQQLVVLFGPQGVYLASPGLVNPEFLEEFSRLGVELVKAQGGTRSH